MAGGEVEEGFVDLLQAPVGFEGEEAAVAGGLQRLEVGAPADFAEADGHADGDVDRVGIGAVEGVFHVEVEEARGEAHEVGGGGSGGAGDVEDVARVPNGAGAVGGERGEDGEGFVGGGDEAGVLVFHAEADAGAGGEIEEAAEVLDDAGLFGGVGGVGRAEEGEDAEEVAVELTRGVEAAFEDVAVRGDGGGVVEIAFEDGGGAAEDASAFAS